MDSSHVKNFDRSKANSAGPNPGRKVRVVAKVRGFAFPEVEAQSGSSRPGDWISVNKPTGESSEVAISFKDHSSSRKDSYWVDYCYGGNEENEMIYSRDVKPLISAVFEGHNSSIIAYGARGSGKTHVIQGSSKIPGLSVLAVAEFLSLAEQNRKSIAISMYEVDYQDHAVDLLNPEQPAILVLEDRGHIQFKGLSQIRVKSISEFQKAYFTACASRKAAMKKGNDHARRTHVGLIVHVFSEAKGTETGSVGKMNFVDLAGYEDARNKSCDSSCLAETNKLNKSIYALLNVCHALSTNESRVPYRESKLTRMLQDSLRGTSRILMVVCMNPSFCQDTIYMLSLASRSRQVMHRVTVDATKKSESCSARQMIRASHKSNLPKSVSSTAKNLTSSRSHIREKKVDVIKSATKGRKLFDEASHSAKAEKEKSIVPVTEALLPSSMDDSVSDARHPVELMIENDDSVLDARYKAELMVKKAVPEKIVDHGEEHTPNSVKYKKALPTDPIVQEGHYMDKENDGFIANKDESPPISAQLRELSNNLKLLLSTPRSVKLPEQDCIISLDNQVSSTDILEPKTPVTEQTMGAIDRWNVMNAKSPWETYSARSSGMKNSLVQDYLSFLNTANKEELKRLKGIGEKRATYILELRDESPEPFKSLDDLQDIGLSAKQIKGMMKREVGELFNH